MPLSPPPSRNSEMFQHDLHHLVAHNANTSYPQQKYEQDEGIHLQSHYNSPALAHEEPYLRTRQQTSFPYQHQHQDSGLGMQYEYHDFQAPMYHEQYSTPATSPPTPSMSSSEMLRTRSGLAIQRGGHHTLRPMPEGRSRSEKSPKLKKVKKEKVKAEKKVAKLEKPLSELTKDWDHVPVVNIEAYVNRSAEERRKEVDEGKVPGKVKRPMNSFMLYRKAYQNRTKDWCLQNNHQVVSQVCGDSWPLEPDSVKEQFSEWARIERINHQNAHPGYKFSPTKPGTSKNSKRKMSEDIASDESDLTDFDWQGSHTKRPKKLRSSAPRQMQQPVVYPTTRSAYHYSSREHSMEPNYASYNKSSYQAANPGKPPPAQYNQADMQPGQYYQQTIHSNPLVTGVEDVIIKKTAAPGAHSYQVSLPGGQEFDIMHPQPQYTSSPAPDFRIDPSLIAQDHVYHHENNNYHESHPDGVYFGGPHDGEHAWQGQYAMNDRGMDPDLQYMGHEQNMEKSQIHDQHMDVLRGNQEGWQIETLDGGREFDNWMGAGEE